MPWKNQNNGADNGRSGPPPERGPWARGPSSGGPPRGIDDLIERGRNRFRSLMPGGPFNRTSFTWVALGLLGLWLASGIYFVSAKEQGVVVRFGRFVARTYPGLNYHLPWPIETAYTPRVTDENQINIGVRQPGEGGENGEEIEEESLMLTGDENIVDVNFTVYWVIKDAASYLFNVENPDQTIKAVAESAMREVVGKSQIESILTQEREPIQIEVRALMQKTLDSYGSGVMVTRVQMGKADPPGAVLDAYRDVQAARADQDRLRNEAEAYANKIIPEARGQSARIVQQSQAYRQQVIAEAVGEAKRFLSVYEEYRKAPEITRRRIYLETMSDVLAPMNKVIIDSAAGKNVLPYLPLPSGSDRGQGGGVTVLEGSDGMSRGDQNAASRRKRP